MILSDEDFMLLTNYLISPLYEPSERVPADKGQETIQPDARSLRSAVLPVVDHL
jgi:hypothetical protein